MPPFLCARARSLSQQHNLRRKQRHPAVSRIRKLRLHPQQKVRLLLQLRKGQTSRARPRRQSGIIRSGWRSQIAGRRLRVPRGNQVRMRNHPRTRQLEIRRSLRNRMELRKTVPLQRSSCAKVGRPSRVSNWPADRLRARLLSRRMQPCNYWRRRKKISRRSQASS